jgi:ankyrin repeat protein
MPPRMRLNTLGDEAVKWKNKLIGACAKCNETSMKELLRDKSNHPTVAESALRQSLQIVAQRGHKPLVSLLLTEKAQCQAEENETSALLRAVNLGHHEIVGQLLRYGASTEERDKFKRTPLFLAASKGLVDVMKVLVEAGADVNAKDTDSRTVVLHLATE